MFFLYGKPITWCDYLDILEIYEVSHHEELQRFFFAQYPLSYGVPVRERYGSTLLPATREQQDQNCTQSH